MSTLQTGIVVPSLHTFSIIPTEELETLRKENIELKAKISTLYQNEKILEELRVENKELKSKNETLQKEIEELKRENSALKLRIKELENDVKELRTKVNKMERTQSIQKYIIAIQDVNRLRQLEKTIPILKDLRSSRNETSHYIDENIDSKSLQQEKLNVLSEKLHNMDSEVKKHFDFMYPNLIKDIIPHINTGIKSIDEKDIYKATYWWE